MHSIYTNYNKPYKTDHPKKTEGSNTITHQGYKSKNITIKHLTQKTNVIDYCNKPPPTDSYLHLIQLHPNKPVKNTLQPHLVNRTPKKKKSNKYEGLRPKPIKGSNTKPQYKRDSLWEKNYNIHAKNEPIQHQQQRLEQHKTPFNPTQTSTAKVKISYIYYNHNKLMPTNKIKCISKEIKTHHTKGVNTNKQQNKNLKITDKPNINITTRKQHQLKKKYDYKKVSLSLQSTNTKLARTKESEKIKKRQREEEEAKKQKQIKQKNNKNLTKTNDNNNKNKNKNKQTTTATTTTTDISGLRIPKMTDTEKSPTKGTKRKRDKTKDKTENKDEDDDIAMDDKTTPKNNEPPTKKQKQNTNKINDTSPHNPLFGALLTPNKNTHNTERENKPPFQSPPNPNIAHSYSSAATQPNLTAMTTQPNITNTLNPFNLKPNTKVPTIPMLLLPSLNQILSPGTASTPTLNTNINQPQIQTNNPRQSATTQQQKNPNLQRKSAQTKNMEDQLIKMKRDLDAIIQQRTEDKENHSKLMKEHLRTMTDLRRERKEAVKQQKEATKRLETSNKEIQNLKLQIQQSSRNEQNHKKELSSIKKKEKDYINKINELKAEVKSEKSDHEFTKQTLMAMKEKNLEIKEELDNYKQQLKQQQDSLQQLKQQNMEANHKINALTSQITQQQSKIEEDREMIYMLTSQQPPKSPIKHEAKSNTDDNPLPPSAQPQQTAPIQPQIQDHFTSKLKILISANKPKLLDQTLTQKYTTTDNKLHILEWDTAECKAVFEDVVRVYTERNSAEYANIMKEAQQFPISKLPIGPQTVLCT